MICGKCCVNMTSGRMGVIVKVVRSTKRGETVRFHHGDESICPTCGAVMIASMGEGYDEETRTPDFTVKA